LALPIPHATPVQADSHIHAAPEPIRVTPRVAISAAGALVIFG